MARTWSVLAVVLTLSPAAAVAQHATLNVTTKNDTDLERLGKAQVERLVEEYDIGQWLFTRDVVVESRVIPHSHPVLTLSTEYVRDDVRQLATLLHEQFHWPVGDADERREATLAEFRALFPDAPDRSGQGARDRYSTYLHLIVCDLEFQAMTALVGLERARQVLASWDHYEWIYDKVLNDARIREVNRRHGWAVDSMVTRGS